KLFITKGYAHTTVEAIIQEIGIAKGTFYYYFSSKEDVMNAVVIRIVDRVVQDAMRIVKDTQLTAPEKLFHIIMGQTPQISEKEDMIEELHQVEDRKSTRLNSSHVSTSYAVFCLKKKKQMRSQMQ